MRGAPSLPPNGANGNGPQMLPSDPRMKERKSHSRWKEPAEPQPFTCVRNDGDALVRREAEDRKQRDQRE